MKNNRYKILVLSDLKKKSVQVLDYASKLSNEIDANIELFYVKAATEVAETENPLSAMRIISDVSNRIDKKVKDLVLPIARENNIKIKTSFAFGNVKNEIENHIKLCKPDMIILGERQQKGFRFLGDNITELVNKHFKGVVFIATDKNVLDTEGNVSLDNLGLKNNIDNYNIKHKDTLIA